MSFCIICSRGLYSCHCKDPIKEGKYACCWFSFVALVSLLSLCWMYICLVTYNDQDDVNWLLFKKLQLWVDWFMILIIISAVLTSYCVLLLLFALFQIALQQPLNLHWLNKIFLFLGMMLVASSVTAMCLMWSEEWPTVPLSLRATGPFLQLGAVGALTLLSPFVFNGFHNARDKCSKFLIALVFVAVSTTIFLCPLYIQPQAPCLIELDELPKKPDLIGHRGAPMLAPENTMMSFNRSIACGVTAFETDVQLSKDRIPFLMHDQHPGFLTRTTNVKEKLPDHIFSQSTNLTWKELQSLNAGEWFQKTDPFHSVSSLSEDDINTARNQTIPSLLQLLNLAKQHNISVIFDLYGPDTDNDTEDVVKTILKSGIDPRLVLWLPPRKRDFVKKTAPGFIQVYNDSEKLQETQGSHLNVKYSFSMEEIRKQRSNNVTVNLWVVNERWLFSLLWCAGASSVTTNSCHLLKDMKRPVLHMGRQIYKITWISVDVLSFFIMTGVFIYSWKCQRARQRNNTSVTRENEIPLLQLNVIPTLPECFQP